MTERPTTRRGDPVPYPFADEPLSLAFAPLLYVAWADGDLTPEEVEALCSRVRDVTGLDDDCNKLVGRWLDPERPPTPHELQSLLATIRAAGAGLGRAEKRSLLDLGVDLARAGGAEPDESVRQALASLTAALGLTGGEAARALLVEDRPDVSAADAAPPAFPVAELTLLLDGPQRPVRERMRRLLSTPAFAYRYGLATEEYRELVLAWCRTLAAEGFGALGFPQDSGGGGDPRAFIASFETLAFHDLSLLVKFGVQFGLFGGSIQQLGTEDHHRRYLPAAGTLALPGAFAMSESGHGSNVAELETLARYDPATQELVVHTPRPEAQKDWIGNAARDGRLATVFAQLEVAGEHHGVHAILVPIRDAEGRPAPGVAIEDCGEKLGLNGVDNGRLLFDQVRVPRENLLDRFAEVTPEGEYRSPIASPAKRFFTMLGTLVGGRISVALAGVSTAKTALTIAVRYGERRRQFGPEGAPEVRLLDYPAHQRRLLPRLATTYALHFALQDLADRYVTTDDEGRREVEALAAGLKAFSSDHATDTIRECRRACGGQGYLAVNRFPSLLADAEIFTTFEGDNTVLRQLVAKSLLTGYRRQFGELNVLGLLRYVAGRAGTAIAELNPIVTRLSDEEHLRDPDFHSGALGWREDHMLATLARRIKRRLDGDADPFTAVTEVQTHLLAVADAHIERLVQERFREALAACPEGAMREVLTTVADLAALSAIERGRAWFQAHGVLEAGKARAIRKLIDRLCAELRPHALPLVDAFGIPDAILAAPIALGDGPAG